MANQPAKSMGKIRFSSGLMLELILGDITQFEVDAVVNAANKHLQHGGGVAGAISRRGGPVIQAESNAWIAEHGQIEFQSPAYTSGGSLPCKFVIHAVGPIWGEGDENNKLEQAISGALRLADQLEITSIAFPAISTGIFGFPPEKAAHVFMRAFNTYAKTALPEHLEDIFLVLFDNKTVESFASVFNNFSWENSV